MVARIYILVDAVAASELHALRGCMFASADDGNSLPHLEEAQTD